MKVVRFLCVLLMAFSNPVYASKCAPNPNVRALVEGLGRCLLVTFDATPYTIVHPSGRTQTITSAGPRVSGVLIEVRVISSELVWSTPGPHSKVTVRPWESGTWRSLFVSGNPEEVCPTFRVKKKTVVVERQCCGDGNEGGKCLIPHNVDVIYANDVPDTWHLHSPRN